MELSGPWGEPNWPDIRNIQKKNPQKVDISEILGVPTSTFFQFSETNPRKLRIQYGGKWILKKSTF